MYWDSDIAKWIEAASYSLATHPDPALDALLDEVVARIARRSSRRLPQQLVHAASRRSAGRTCATGTSSTAPAT